MNLIAAIIILVVSSTNSYASSESDTYFLQGLLAMNSNKIVLAEKYFDSAAVMSDSSEWIQLFQAKIYLAKSDTERAKALLDELSVKGNSRISFDAAMFRAEIVTESETAYSSMKSLLSFIDDSIYGAEAAYLCGEILIKSGDTESALKIWTELSMLFPKSEEAYKSVLKISELSESLNSFEPYLLYRMAKCAFEHGDAQTASMLLKPLTRRRVDRRLRDDILLLQAEADFKLSSYREAFESYRDAASVTQNLLKREKAELGLILCKLYIGDSESRAAALKTIKQSKLEDRLADTIAMLASLMRCRGDSETYSDLMQVISTPTFESFIHEYHRAVSDSSLAINWRTALDVAERIEDSFDKALASALLAENSPLSAADLWRQTISLGASNYLILLAEDNITKKNDSNRATLEADALLNAALREFNLGRINSAFSLFRVLRLSYPGTVASFESEKISRKIIEPYFRIDSKLNRDLQTAQILIEGKAFQEAINILKGRYDPASVMLRIDAYEKSGLFHKSIREAEDFINNISMNITLFDIPETFLIHLFPIPYKELFRLCGESYGIDPALLASIARIQTRFDPYFQSGYRVGIAGVDVDATTFAKNFIDAPKLEPFELLIPSKAVALQAWLLKNLKSAVNDSAPYKIASAYYSGPANLPNIVNCKNELEWISSLPFKSARVFALDFQYAYSIYKKYFQVNRAR